MNSTVNKEKSFRNIPTDIIVCLLIISSILIVYNKVSNHDFSIFDDNLYVCENNHVTSGLTSENIKWAFSFSADKTYWHPLSWISHMSDCQLFGLDAGKHHMVNVFFHILNSILLFVVLRMMTGAKLRSGFVALLFALHPLNVDSVAWIAERKNVLSSFFWMLTMISYVYYTRNPKFIRYIVTLLIFILGLLAKPMLVTLPCVFLLLDYWPLRRIDNRLALPISEYPQVSFSRLLLEKIPFLAFSFILISAAMFSLENINGVISYDAVPMPLRISNALVSYVVYLKKMILPVNLAVFYPFPKSLPVWQVAGAVLFLLLISLTTIRFLKRTPYIAVGWFWFLGTLVPVIGIVQGGLWPALADRWSYVPLIGMFIAITWGISELCGILKVNRLLLFFPATIILIVLAIMSRNQLGYWKDSFTLFDHAQKVTIDNYYAKATLAVILEKQGKEKEAEYYYNEALRLGPNFPECHLSFGVFLSKQGKQSKALYHFAEALRLLPESVDVHYNIAAVFFKQGNTAKAIEHYLNGLRLKPDSEKILINLGNVYLSLDDISTAEKYYKEALQLNPSASKAYYHLGLVAEKKGDTKAIIKNYEAALNINPDYVEAHTNLAVTLHSIGQVQNAMYHLREVLRTNPDNQSAYNNLTLLSNTPALKKIKLNIQKLKSALVKSSGNAVVFYKLGMMYSLQGDYLNALPAFQKALDLKSGFIEALDNMATLYVMTNNYDDAITKYKKMIELQPENNTIYYNMCCAYSKQGKTEKSVKYLKKAINKGFDDWEYLKNDADLEKIRDTDYYQNLIAEVHLPKK